MHKREKHYGKDPETMGHQRGTLLKEPALETRIKEEWIRSDGIAPGEIKHGRRSDLRGTFYGEIPI